MLERLRDAVAREATQAIRDTMSRMLADLRRQPPPGALRRALTNDAAGRCAALPREPWMCDDCTPGRALSRPCDAVCRTGWARRWEQAVGDPPAEYRRG